MDAPQIPEHGRERFGAADLEKPHPHLRPQLLQQESGDGRPELLLHLSRPIRKTGGPL